MTRTQMSTNTKTGNLFDRLGFVRSEGQKPPLSELFILNLGGIRFSSTCLLNTLLIVAFHVYYFRIWKLWGFALYIFLVMGTCVLDTQVSNGFSHNIRNLRKAGFSDSWTMFCMEFNRVASQLIGYAIVNYIVLAKNPEVFSWASLSQSLLSLSVWGKIVVNLGVSEVLFFCGHGLMHTSPIFVDFHIFHHCCTTPTFATNLMFHPVDLSIEFAGPAGCLLAMHFLVWDEDASVLLITYLIFQLWYAYDHDESMNLYHVQHHQYCDSLYVIYSDYRSSTKANILKDIMRDKMGIKLGPADSIAVKKTSSSLAEDSKKQN